MIEAPKQNWLAYAAVTSEVDADWIRSLTAQDRFAIYEDAFNLINSSRGELGDWDRLDRWRWKQKVTLHSRLRHAYTNLDRVRCGLAASTNTN